LGGWVVTLAKASWEVAATYHTHRCLGKEVAWRHLDIRDEARVAALLAELEPDVVVHTAALSSGLWEGVEQVNVAGTRHVARATAACGARLVHLSTDLVFDGAKGSYLEEDETAPLTEYGRSKALAEEEVRRCGTDHAIVRTSLIYSWQPKLDRHTRWLRDRLSAGEAIHLFTDELRCPIWVGSLARALLELAQTRHSGVLHVAGSQSLSRYDYGVRILRFHGLDPSPVIPALSSESGVVRPLDTTLDCARARDLLATPLPGVDEVLCGQSPRA
jgi:dTDP-4-dehydrorhamnose reductase